MKLADPDYERRQVVAEIRDAAPGVALIYGIDRKGCYAQLGDLESRATDCTAALRGVLAKARGGEA